MPRSRRGEGAFAPYLKAIQAHRAVFIGVVLVCVVAAIAYIASATKEYSATAEVLVTPVAQENQAFIGLEVLRESGDPTRTVQTAAALLESREAAEATAEKLNDGRSGKQILDSIRINPEGESNVLDIAAKATSPKQASQTANVYAKSALAIRSERLQAQIEEEIERLDAGSQSNRNKERIAQLETLETRGDPTLSISQEATADDSPIGASAALVVGLALIAGLALGTGAAVILEMGARKIRDENEALDLYPVPILARVPLVSRRSRTTAMNPAPAVRESFRTMLTQFEHTPGGKSILFTSGSTADGKTTSSINMATTSALAGHSTILIDMDLRKPGVDEVIGVNSRASIETLLDDPDALEAALVPVPGLTNLGILSPTTFGVHDEIVTERLMSQFEALLDRAQALAEYVIIDTAPLGEVSDALRLTRFVDRIIVVVRPGNTNTANYNIMRDLLERSGDRASGLLVIGDRTGASSTYYSYGQDRQSRGPDRPTRQK